MKTHIFLIGIFIIAASMGCNKSGPNMNAESEVYKAEELSGTIKIEGSYALYPLVKEWAEAFQQDYPNITVFVEKSTIIDINEEMKQKSLDLVMCSKNPHPNEGDSNLWRLCVSKMGVVPIMCSKNPFAEELMKKGITQEQLIRIFSSTHITWDDLLNNQSTESINNYIRDVNSGAQDVWQDYLYLLSDEIKGILISGDDEMISAIQEDPYGIGFCNLIYAFDPATGDPVENIQVIPLDLNYNGSIDFKERGYNNLMEYQRAICLGKYPKSLCRSLQLMALKRPEDPVIKTFIKWILTDGQVIVEKAGYVKLNHHALECALTCLEGKYPK